MRIYVKIDWSKESKKKIENKNTNQCQKCKLLLHVSFNVLDLIYTKNVYASLLITKKKGSS